MPGTGWTGPIVPPPGTGAIPIADWDVVPYDVVDSTRYIGLVAFHPSGIQRVDFSVNGGPITSVTSMTLNPHTATTDPFLISSFGSAVREYVVALNPALFSSSMLAEVRAVVYPNSGRPVVLQGPTDPSHVDFREDSLSSMFLHISKNGGIARPTRYVSNTGSGSLCTQQSPCGSIAAAAASIQSAQGNVNHGIIYLAPGVYDGTVGSVTNTQAWLTISAAPGVNTLSDVTIVSFSSGSHPKYMRFNGLRIMASVPYGNYSPYNPPYFWYNNIESTAVISGEGRGYGTQVNLSPNQHLVATGWVNRGYATNIHVFNQFDGLDDLRLVRNARINHLTDSAISGVQTAINVLTYDLTKHWQTWTPPIDPHPDISQPFSRDYYTIVYGLEAIQAIDARGMAWVTSMLNGAIVNALVDTTTLGGVGAVFQFGGPHNNVYVKNSVFVGASYIASTFTGTNVVIEDTFFFNTAGGTVHSCPDVVPPATLAGVSYIRGGC